MRALQSWLLEANLISPEDLRALQGQDPPLEGYSLASALLEQRLVDEVQLVATVSQRLGIPAAPARLHREPIPASVLSGIPEDLCWQHHIFPFGIDRGAGRLRVAMADPSDEEALTALRATLGHLPLIHVIGPRQLEKAIRKHYLDSWVDETRGGDRRFFGYENITNPGADPKRAPTKSPTSPPAPQAPAAIAPEPALDGVPLEAESDELTHRRRDDVPSQGYPTDAVMTSRKQPVARLGRVALREESLRDRLSAIEQAVGDLLDLLTELPDARVSSTAAQIRKRLQRR